MHEAAAPMTRAEEVASNYRHGVGDLRELLERLEARVDTICGAPQAVPLGLPELEGNLLSNIQNCNAVFADLRGRLLAILDVLESNFPAPVPSTRLTGGNSRA